MACQLSTAHTDSMNCVQNCMHPKTKIKQSTLTCSSTGTLGLRSVSSKQRACNLESESWCRRRCSGGEAHVPQSFQLFWWVSPACARPVMPTAAAVHLAVLGVCKCKLGLGPAAVSDLTPAWGLLCLHVLQDALHGHVGADCLSACNAWAARVQPHTRLCLPFHSSASGCVAVTQAKAASAPCQHWQEADAYAFLQPWHRQLPISYGKCS